MNYMIKVGFIVASIYLLFTPYRMLFLVFVTLFLAWTAYRYIIWRAEREADI